MWKSRKDGTMWPSNQFTTYPKFVDLSKMDKEKLIEKAQGCTSCLDFTGQHKAKDCMSLNKCQSLGCGSSRHLSWLHDSGNAY